MKAYVITTGAVFGVLTLVHIWRAIVEPHALTEPFWVLITLLAAALCVWAVRLLLRWPRA